MLRLARICRDHIVFNEIPEVFDVARLELEHNVQA